MDHCRVLGAQWARIALVCGFRHNHLQCWLLVIFTIVATMVISQLQTPCAHPSVDIVKYHGISSRNSKSGKGLSEQGQNLAVHIPQMTKAVELLGCSLIPFGWFVMTELAIRYESLHSLAYAWCLVMIPSQSIHQPWWAVIQPCLLSSCLSTLFILLTINCHWVLDIMNCVNPPQSMTSWHSDYNVGLS